MVRGGAGMVPTDVGLRMIEPSASILRAAEVLFDDARSFDAASTRATFRIAASDYLDPEFLPRLMAQIKALAPLAEIEVQALSGNFDYRARLAQGEIDVVVGNWAAPPHDLHLARLSDDEVVCLVSQKHPAVRRGWDQAAWLEAEHIAPGATHPGAKGVIDEHLASLGLQRHIVARCAYFGLIPAMVSTSLLVLTTGRQYCSRFVDSLPVAMVDCPVEFPPMRYYQLWHERSHASAANRWLRERVKEVAASLTRN